MKTFLIRFLFFFLCYFGFSLWEAHPEFVAHLANRYGGHYEFLTMISSLLTLFTLSVCIMTSLGSFFAFILSPIKNSLIGVMLPVNTLVSLLYWSLKWYNPSFIIQPNLNNKLNWGLPILTDISLHFIPFFSLFIEFFFFSPNFSFNIFHGILLIFYNALYFIWINYLYHENKKWVYPFLNHFSQLQMVLFLITTSISSLALYSFYANLHYHISSNKKSKDKVKKS